MTGNIALDIFISLAFIYLLYSLYATVIIEMIASIFRLRARNLRFTLRRMLTDNQEKHILRCTKRYFKIGWKRKIKLLLKLKRQDKFKILRLRIKQQKASNIFYCFLAQPTIQYLTKPGWTFRHGPSYLAPHSFSKALLDSLKGTNSDDTLIARIQEGLYSNRIDEKTKKHLISLLEDANNDVQKFKLLIEQWFNDTMERSVGWYKRNIQKILFIVGLVIAVVFNLNTVHITKLLSNNSEARNQLVKIAIESQSNYGNYIELLAQTKKPESIEYRAIKKQLDTLSFVKDALEKDIQKTKVLFGGGWKLPDKLSITLEKPIGTNYYVRKKNNKELYILKPELEYLLDSISVTRSIGKVWFRLSKDYKTKQINYIFKPNLYKIKYALRNFLGYLLTAIAISLGAPFWFDLLNKLIRLRSSIPKQVETEQNQSDSKLESINDIMNRKG